MLTIFVLVVNQSTVVVEVQMINKIQTAGCCWSECRELYFNYPLLCGTGFVIR
jgi:hypothetical protein